MVLSILSDWLVRSAMGIGGACLVVFAVPVAQGAWQAQKADAVMTDLRVGHRLDPAKVRAGIDALGRAIAAEPIAERYLDRSELMAGAALAPGLEVSAGERLDWERVALSDLEKGLANAPARGAGWLRLATMRDGVDGATRDLLPPLFLSIDYAPLLPPTWVPRLRVILHAWPYFSDAQKDKVAAYMRLVWRVSVDRRFFADLIRSPVDELIIRFFLRDDPAAQKELTRLIIAEMRR
jgi:hypothetical protein